MKLTEKHIDELYKFTRQHYVEHYDLQTELVDHLANDIEEIWKERPTLSFNEAKVLAFKKFGVFGFMNVVEQKQKQMSKKYLKVLWSFAKEWFRLPKIVLTLMTMYMVYELIQLPYARGGVFVIFAITIIYATYKMMKLRKRIRKKQRKWMMEEMLLTQGSSMAFIIATYPLHFMNFTSRFTEGYITAFTSIMIVLISILIYVSLEVIPSKAEKLLEDTYPEYKLL